MKETLSLRICSLFLATFICWFYPCSAGGQKPSVKSVGRVTVVDSKGKTVATLLGGLGLTLAPAVHNIKFTPIVLLDVDGPLIAVNIAREGFFTTTILYYESTNCSGTPWLVEMPPLHGLLPSVAIGPPGHTVYVPAGDPPSRLPSIRSALADGRCFVPFVPRSVMVPTEALIDLETEFTPPFRLRSGP